MQRKGEDARHSSVRVAQRPTDPLLACLLVEWPALWSPAAATASPSNIQLENR